MARTVSLTAPFLVSSTFFSPCDLADDWILAKTSLSSARPATRTELAKIKKGLAKAKTKGAAALLEALNE